MGVFQGSRCNSVGNTTSSSLDRQPLPYPACGEMEVSTEGLGGYWGQTLASLARANPCMSRPPFSNTSCVKVSRQLLGMSITLRRMGTGYYCLPYAWYATLHPLPSPPSLLLLLHTSPCPSFLLTPRHLKHKVAQKAQRFSVTRCRLPSHTDHRKSHRHYCTPGGLCRIRDLLGPRGDQQLSSHGRAKAPHSSAARDCLGLCIPSLLASQAPIST